MDSLTIRRPDDFHLHVRQGEMMKAVLPVSADMFARALIMPNTDPPVETGDDLARYCAEIEAASHLPFTPLMTIKITGRTDAATIRSAARAGAVAGKLYPFGVTTNSGDGVRDIRAAYPAFAEMARVGLVLCVHCEELGVFCLDREEVFLTAALEPIVTEFPQLRVVVEHASTAAAVNWVCRQRDQHGRLNIAATITPHHLRLTLDDVVGDLLSPHNFCKPVAKRPQDREALVAAATSGDPGFFLGTDSAPHPRGKKECGSGCAGVFSAPVALPLLAEVFEAAGTLPALEQFTSVSGAMFYGLALNEGGLRLAREPWQVPLECAGVVPFLAGQRLAWSVSEQTGMEQDGVEPISQVAR